MKTPVVRPFLALPLLLSCLLFLGGDAELDREEWTARGQETLKPFKKALMSALMQGLKDGPETAIEVCGVRAPELAAEAGSETVRMGRVSHRLRNPKNAPKPWMEPLLAAYVKDPEKKDPEVVRLADGGVGYVEPIVVGTTCLRCHGEELVPSLAAKIVTLYPEDEATGFAAGDFRGLFWVEFLDEAPAASATP